jgi:ribosomal protein L12E/L44/L45/RPP1/RPP2
MGIGNAIIGALRVNLGLDSAQFTAGLKLAQGEVGQFSRIAKTGLIGLSTAALGVAAALALATKGAINHADAMSKMAQKAGVTTESLSRLAYAASFSDVQTDELTASLGKLSKSMADAAANATGQTASAFAALGISVVDSSGKLRSADAVFIDLADRFSRIEDGSTKTAIAMTLLGKSGANLIPLLNEGAAKLKRYADESDRTGNTISTKTGKAAEEFNDTMARVGTTLAGIANKLAEALLPDLQKFADAIAGMNPEVLKWGGLLVAGLAALAPVTIAIGAAAPVIGTMTAAVVSLNTALLALAGTLATPALLAGLGLLLSTSPAGGGEDALVKKLGLTKLPQAGGAFSGGWGAGALPGGPSGVAPSTFDFSSFFKTGSSSGIDLSLFTDPAGKKVDTLTDKIAKLKDGLAAIGPAAGLAQQAMADGFDTAVGALGNLSGALSSAFKDSKAFAVSTAILQGLQGVAYALGSSAPPWNFINAAAVGIEAAANVASILSTNEHSTSMPSGGSAAGVAAAAPSPSSAINLTVRGSGMISVDDFVDQITKGIADGGHQNFIKVQKAALV